MVRKDIKYRSDWSVNKYNLEEDEDDILIAANTNKKIEEIKSGLADRFKVKDMVELHYLLGVKIIQDQKIWTGQPTYMYAKEVIKLRQENDPSLKFVKDDVNATYVDQLRAISISRWEVTLSVNKDKA